MAARHYASALQATYANSLTPLRSEVLALLRAARAPLKAYQLIDMLAQRRGAPVKPPTIYRTLEYLVSNGLVHRIESLGAYAACVHQSAGPEHVFLICERCGEVIEAQCQSARHALDDVARHEKFIPHQTCIEVRGCCATCAGAQRSHSIFKEGRCAAAAIAGGQPDAHCIKARDAP